MARSMHSAESALYNLLLCGAAFNPIEEKLFTGSFCQATPSRILFLCPRLRRFAITYAACPLSELGWKYFVAWLAMLDGYAGFKWNSDICDTSSPSLKNKT